MGEFVVNYFREKDLSIAEHIGDRSAENETDLKTEVFRTVEEAVKWVGWHTKAEQ